MQYHIRNTDREHRSDKYIVRWVDYDFTSPARENFDNIITSVQIGERSKMKSKKLKWAKELLEKKNFDVSKIVIE